MKMLKFYADWCGPCKSLTAIMEGVDLPIEVQEVNIDEDRETTMKYNVRGVPTCIIVEDNGDVVASKTGAMTKAQLEVFVESNV
jgi:thioredoxin 1